MTRTEKLDHKTREFFQTLIELPQKYKINPCRECGATDLRVERYFDAIGVVFPPYAIHDPLRMRKLHI